MMEITKIYRQEKTQKHEITLSRKSKQLKISFDQTEYRISSYSFRTFMYCDLWISKFKKE